MRGKPLLNTWHVSAGAHERQQLGAIHRSGSHLIVLSPSGQRRTVRREGNRPNQRLVPGQQLDLLLSADVPHHDVAVPTDGKSGSIRRKCHRVALDTLQ